MEMRLNREAGRAARTAAAAGACVRKKVPESRERRMERERGRVRHSGGVEKAKDCESQNFKEEDWLKDHPVATGPVCTLNSGPLIFFLPPI